MIFVLMNGMSKKPDLFPLGIATGSAHCNRAKERDKLKRHILNLTHTWLWARRRMGKTSLIEQVLEDLRLARRKLASLTIDLLVVHDAEELERRIRQGVQRLGVEIMPKGHKATAKLAKAFKDLNPKFSVGGTGVSVELGKSESAVQGIEELLMALDTAAGLYRRRVVIVLDEFQQLSEMKDGDVRTAAEGAIRHAVERAKNITYIFAGSQKHLLRDMFENEDRPLYRLCRKMVVERIEEPAYREFLRAASKTKWRRFIGDDRIEQILDITFRHPYYVNALCARIWEGARLPTENAIDAAWEGLIEEDKSLVTGKVLRLSAAQRAMLKGIAHSGSGVPHPASNAFLQTLRLPASTGNHAKEVLERQDFIQQDANRSWILVDPVMASYLKTL